MSIIPAKTPGFVKSLFPNFVWHIETTKKELYLTFDDGPTPCVTEWVLKTLKDFDAKATFFCIGKNIGNHLDIFKAIISEGHSVGNHTYNHLKGWKNSTKAYIEDTEETRKLINLNVSESANKPSGNKNLFRPPYGKFKVTQSQQLQKLGYTIILWDVLSFDWSNSVTPKACLQNVTSAAKEGSIVVFHDSEKAFNTLKQVLPEVLKHYSDQGYTFKPL